jgi:lysophospholipase L1-like esterase
LKRIIALISLLCLIFSFVACRDNSESASVTESDNSECSTESTVSTEESSETVENSDISDVSVPADAESSDHADESGEHSEDNAEDNSDISDVSEETLPEESKPEVSEPDESDDTSKDEKPEHEKEKVTLFDSSDAGDYAHEFLPSYAPFCLYDTGLFSDTVITSISFPYFGLSSGYSIDSDKLYMPIYVIKTDFSTAKEDCTVDNGKKIILDFTGKLHNVQRGDWLTADGLNISVAADETIAFGDTDMAVLPMFLRNVSTYGFWNRVFDNKGTNNHSLIFKIEGYSFKNNDSIDTDNGENYISFLGDSISTYSNWSNNTKHNSTIGGNAIWYPNSNYTGGQISVEETWWHRVAVGIDYDICVNNSWSGSRVYDAHTYNTRAKNLHNTSNGAKPDVIVILMGVNDYAAGTAVGACDGKGSVPEKPSNFSEAYARMVYNIKNAYPDAEIYCCTFLPDRKRFNGGNNSVGISENEYNEAIRKIAINLDVNLIDLYNDSGIDGSNISKYTVDKLHPNSVGMSLVSKTVINAII